MAADNENGRATLARVISELASQDRRAEERHADIKTDLGIVKLCVNDLNSRMREVEIEQARNEEQHKAMKAAGIILSTIESTLAGLLGVFANH